MATINIYGTLSNIANKALQEREGYRQLEAIENSGVVNTGDEIIAVPAAKLITIKTKLNEARIKVEKLATAIGADIVYNKEPSIKK